MFAIFSKKSLPERLLTRSVKIASIGFNAFQHRLDACSEAMFANLCSKCCL